MTEEIKEEDLRKSQEEGKD